MSLYPQCALARWKVAALKRDQNTTSSCWPQGHNEETNFKLWQKFPLNIYFFCRCTFKENHHLEFFLNLYQWFSRAFSWFTKCNWYQIDEKVFFECIGIKITAINQIILFMFCFGHNGMLNLLRNYESGFKEGELHAVWVTLHGLLN